MRSSLMEPTPVDRLESTTSRALREPSVYQLGLWPSRESQHNNSSDWLARLQTLLASDLGFHGHDTSYASHDFHAFPAKFPPQLPRLFIQELTQAGDVVLDPMMGSGTTVVEAYLAGCQAIGVDIDPLAKLIAEVKTTPLGVDSLHQRLNTLVKRASQAIILEHAALESALEIVWDEKARNFIDYWFARETQIEITAILRAIAEIEDQREQDFFKLALSASIITKSGGVSLAFDLAHTRPHRAKIVYSSSGRLILGEHLNGEETSKRTRFLTKNLRSAVAEFRKRSLQNIRSLAELPGLKDLPARIHQGDAQYLPVRDSTVDLIVTSPPYASNAIDYMRANKFSLIWLGHSLEHLGETRKQCIGGESTIGFAFEPMPAYATQVIAEITQLDPAKGQTLHRYYSEMTRILREIHRVLKPGRAAVVVVASSIMRNRDTETDKCLVEIGQSIGFHVPHVGIRRLDRNRRMMPAGHQIDKASQIQQRMHEEFVIGFYKPEVL